MTDLVCNTVLFKFEDLAQKNHFKEALKDDDAIFSFNKIIPMPEEIKNMDFWNGRLQWCIKNWGVKYMPVSDPESWCNIEIISEGEQHILYRFFTPWSVPLQIGEKLRKDFLGYLFLDMFWYGCGDCRGEDFELYA